MDTFSPPNYSLNSFFVRHVAHPKRMKYISGLNNARICAVNDDGYFNRPPQPPPLGQPASSSSLSMAAEGKSGPALLSRRKEKLVPPGGIWKTYGLIDDTEKWRKELNSLATSVGLITEDDIDNYKKRKEREEMIKSIQQLPKSPMHRLSRTPQMLQKASKPATSNGTAPSTRALNEPLNTGRKSRQSRSHSRLTGLVSSSTKKYVVNQADREVWVREVTKFTAPMETHCYLKSRELVDASSPLPNTSD